MKRLVLKRIMLLLTCLLLIACFLAGCSAKGAPSPEPSVSAVPSPEPSASAVPSPEPSASAVPTPEPADIPQPIAYSVDYTRSTELFTQLYGQSVIDDAAAVVRAFLAGENKARYSKKDFDARYPLKLTNALIHLCPLISACTDFGERSAFKNGTVSWKYLYDAKTVRRMTDDFEERIEGIMSKVDKRDCVAAQAMTLYYELTREAVYDYAYIEKKTHTSEESRLATSAYQALVNRSGVCYSYAEAYAFLLTQLGIDSISIMGDSPEQLHSWTMARLDGEYYYFDPTWDIGGSFRYFGLTALEREGDGFLPEKLTVAVYHDISDFSLTSDRFSPMHSYLQGVDSGFALDHASQKASLDGFIFSCR